MPKIIEKMSETEQEQAAAAIGELTRKVLDVNTENNRLRAENKHILRMGVVCLEILPIGGMRCEDLFSEFTQFAEKLHSMHGDEHLKATFVQESSTGMHDEIVSEMFG
jgi:iron-sulfur cluster repair protein YtfE (RIC family)